MSIQINGVNAIDGDRNFSAAGILTVGTGNSATIIDGTTGITSVGIGVTIDGIAGNISIAGTLTAAGFNIPASLISISPANGATDADIATSIVLTFDQAVGVATTGTILLKEGSVGGSTIQTLGVSNILATANGIIIQLNENLGYSTPIYPIIPEGFIKSTSGDFVGLNTTGADSYSFNTRALAPGEAYEGGYFICQASSVRWVVAPSSAEVSRNWYSRNDANTRAQQVSGCTGWFVPTCGQLQNPGYSCRTYWDSYSGCNYWSSTQIDSDDAWSVSVGSGSASSLDKYGGTRCVRAFRCVSY